MKEIRKEEAGPGDYVLTDGDSGFCTASYKKITGIETRYDNMTGQPYSVVVCGDNIYRMDNGCAETPPTRYYIAMFARLDDEDFALIDRIRQLRKQHNDFIKNAESIYMKSVDDALKKAGLDGYYRLSNYYITFTSPYENDMAELEREIPIHLTDEIYTE